MPRLSKIGAAALAAFGWTGLSSVTASYLQVAGGGGGGSGDLGSVGGAGGGAGGYLTGTTTLNPTQSYTVVVGAGGAGGVYSGAGVNGVQGSNSQFGVLTASVGGGFGAYGTAGATGGNGGSGGGGTFGNGGGTATSGQGSNGGTGSSSLDCRGSGGGGGASAVGANGTSAGGGNGGNGTASSITGSSVTYAGGGGGGALYRGGGFTVPTVATGGTGGGGSSGAGTGGNGNPGTANLGGGGGGPVSINAGTFDRGGNGGSGVVIISYVGAQQFGGGVVTSSGGNTIHTFTTSGTLSPLSSLTASYLIVAGGAGGGTSGGAGGGGGAGGLLSGSGVTIDTNSIYLVTVGAGGAASNNGSNSLFSSVSTTAIGGGTGGASDTNGTAGGSGGGASGQTGNLRTGGAGTAGQGNAGGNNTNAPNYGGGGGGGAGAVGGTGTTSASGAGGAGTASSISGSSVTYAGGGGGAQTPSGASAGAGGSGGGGAGGTGVGSAGTANTGGGGGGGNATTGGAGGSGIVIISYAGSTQQMAGGTVTVAGGNVIHTFTSSGYLTPIVLVNNSLRFRSSAGAYLNRTPATTTNRRTWTWSGWVKRGTLGTNQSLFTCYFANNDTSYLTISFTSDNLNIGLWNTSILYTSAVYRDPSAWYHIVLAIDTTQATASDRAKLYVNGVQVTAFGSTGYPAQNTDLAVNSAAAHYISTYDGTNYKFDGYMADINFIDGQALTPNSFGTFNGLGVWQPIRYGGSYGTNGFYLPFTNTTSTTTLGFDFSPNGNNWTPNNISSTTSPTTVQVFNSSSTWTAPAGVSSVNYLVVGAGGGGGNLAGGGGGAGGYRASTLSVAPGTTYTVTIGAGGASATQGGNSVFSSITSTGGGAGGLYDGGTGGTGGSGGGGAGTSGTTGSSAGGAATSGQGSAGGGATATVSGGGGGGGAGAGGSSTGSGSGANGGNGSSSSSITGSTYAGGGGGGNRAFDAGTGGSGGSGGGGGGGGTNRLTPADGTVNTGGGGGGGGFGTSISSTGASGGSGVVVISYTVDSMTDVPTLTSATVANYCVLSPIASSPLISLTNGNLTAGGTDEASLIGTIGVNSGKWYWEVTVTSGSVTPYLGVSSNSFDKSGVGTNFRLAGISWYGNGNKKAYTATSETSATSNTTGVYGFALDISAGTLDYYFNNSLVLTDTTIPTSGVTLFPLVAHTNSGSNSWNPANFNFGQQPFTYTPPTGFVRLNTFNLPTPTIGATASTTANKYMDATLYTGNGTSVTVTNGGAMQPDWVWLKSRSSADQHNLIDVVRGAGNRLRTETTGAEEATPGTFTFNSNGFTSTTSNASFNGNGTTYVAWQWRASNATAVTNTNGSINSTVSANTTAGFSVVTYTGNGTSGATVGHGLGVVPSLVIVKFRKDVALDGPWYVYHSSIGATKNLILNTTAGEATASTPWNNTAPTSSVFSLGNAGDTNGSGRSFVAYCFAQIAGYSAFGSYIGNGSTDGPFVFTGFRPRWILIKVSSGGTGSWILYDTARNTYNVSQSILYPNLSNAEATTSSANLDILSNGFKLRTSNADFNGNTYTYVYAAFAESPFKYANAR